LHKHGKRRERGGDRSAGGGVGKREISVFAIPKRVWLVARCFSGGGNLSGKKTKGKCERTKGGSEEGEKVMLQEGASGGCRLGRRKEKAGQGKKGCGDSSMVPETGS